MSVLRSDSLQRRLMWAFSCLVVVLTAITATIAYYSAARTLETVQLGKLGLEASEKSQTVDLWLTERVRELQVDAHFYHISDPQEVGLRNTNISRILRSSVGPLSPYISKLLLHPDSGEVVFSTDSHDLGKFRDNYKHFLEGRQRSTIETSYFELGSAVNTVIVAVPVRGADGSLKAVLSGHTNRALLANIVGSSLYHSATLKTRQSYLINSRGTFVSYPGSGPEWTRLHRASPLPFVESCLRGDSGSWVGQDKRGVVIMAAYQWLSGRNLCTVVQVERSEVLGPARSHAYQLATVGLLSILVGLVVSLILSRSLTHPLAELRMVSARLGAGDLDAIAKIDREDEIGELAESFNFMARSLKTRDKKIRTLNNELKDRIERLHQTQSELIRKERLATLGQLTATVSHELRNPLGVMRPSLYILKKCLPTKDSRLIQAFERLDRSINRCDHIIDELLDFTRIQDMDNQPLVFDEWLGELLDEQSAPEGLVIERDLALGDTILAIDSERLRRAIINVYDNACQAMSDGLPGNPVLARARLRIATRMNEERVELEMADTGPGIPDEVLPHIFEPLYSTKGFGVGLGLPIVKQILEQHDGGVEIHTKPGSGTRMVLWLPRSEARKVTA